MLTRFVGGPDRLTITSARYVEMAHFRVGANTASRQ